MSSNENEKSETKETPRMVYSHLTQTPVEYKGRWANTLYKNEYTRWYRQTKIGLKRRPTKNPDGTLWRDTHPECQLPYTYYKNSPVWTCELCNVEMCDGYKNRHLKSKIHLARERLNLPKVSTPPPELPAVAETKEEVKTPEEIEYKISPIVLSEPIPAIPIPQPIDLNQKIRDKVERNHNNLSNMYRGILHNAVRL